jgi:hypothetical protein
MILEILQEDNVESSLGSNLLDLALKKERVVGRILAALSAGMLVAMLALLAMPGLALALPAEIPDNTPMVNGPVRSIAQVGDNVWVGGNFSQVQQRNGAVVDTVRNLAVFDASDGHYIDIAPSLGGSTSTVKDMEVYGTNIVIAGTFSGPSSTKKNLVVLDGLTGQELQWYNSKVLQSVLVAPALGAQGTIYGGGVGLQAFDIPAVPSSTGVTPLWTRANTAVDPSLRPHETNPGYRDLELDANGETIWAACACDTINGQPAKALAKLDTEGIRDPFWLVNAGVQGYGISLVQDANTLYLGAGGNDFLAAYRKSDGSRAWVRDTSGSAQAVEVMDGGLVVGGHFWEVADREGVNCGNRSSNNSATLDVNRQCETRHALAAYSFNGTLDPNWDPMGEGKYNLVWALYPDERVPEKLHFGGEFTSVGGLTQTNYSRLSAPGSADQTAPAVQGPDQDIGPVGSTLGTSTVPVRIGWSATDDAGVPAYELQQDNFGRYYTYVSLALPTSISKTLQLLPGDAYQFRVRATDGEGNVSPWFMGPQFMVDVHQAADGSLAYSGSWAEEALSTAYGGSTMYSSQAGDTATFTFTGTDVSWVAQKGPDRGKAEVRLDGALVATIDLYTASAQPRRVVYNATSLDPSVSHTLEVRVLGTKRAASTGTRVDVDAFVALPPLP